MFFFCLSLEWIFSFSVVWTFDELHWSQWGPFHNSMKFIHVCQRAALYSAEGAAVNVWLSPALTRQVPLLPKPLLLLHCGEEGSTNTFSHTLCCSSWMWVASGQTCRLSWRSESAGGRGVRAFVRLVRAERDRGSVFVPVRCDRNWALWPRSRSRPYYEHTHSPNTRPDTTVHATNCRSAVARRWILRALC